MPYKIFICYRRVDKELARGIERALSNEFGAKHVFFDIEDIHGGQKWRTKIENAFESEPIVITLVTRRWNSNRNGKPKLMDPKDHVRKELEIALKKGLSIVPVRYEIPNLPKKEKLPESLHPLVDFQSFPFSNERYQYDATMLIRTLRELIGEEDTSDQIARTQSASNGPFLRSGTAANNPVRRANFTLPPNKQKEYLDKLARNAQKEEEKRLKARREAPPFYRRLSFWISVLITLVLSAASLYGAELLARFIANSLDMELPHPPLIAGILLTGIWSIVWIVFGAIFYRFDPRNGSKTFFTRGIFGGWTLGYEDWEPIGYWAAFPVSTSVLWLVAHTLSALAFLFLQWDYMLIFWIVLGAYTIPILISYSTLNSDELY
jgi:hypothetical protein